MRKTCNINCKFFEDIDLFGIDAEVYFKGKSKRSSTVGKVLTILYGILYAAFFIYKLVRMIKKVDVNFYETTTFTGEIPSLYLDNEMFYGGFGLIDGRTMTTFVDPTIYTARAVFYDQKKVNNRFDGNSVEVELEVCDLNKFGSKYHDLFADKSVDKLYCFKKMDYTIAGHTTYDIYNYFQIFFYPCHNTTENGNHCQDINLIKALLHYTGVTVKIQDLELTPENYERPTTPRVRELTAPVMQSLYQNINAYFHIISIESDTDVLGFEALSDYKAQKFFKYDVTFIMTSTNSPTSIEDGDGYCDITIQLTEQVITIKRTYTKLIEALGDVGGLMEFVFSFFRIISSFLTETLYEKSLVNSLFSFDMDKKIILFKNTKNEKKNNSQTIDSPQINNNLINSNKIYNENHNLYNNEEKSQNQNNQQEAFNSNEVIVYRDMNKRRTSINKSKNSTQRTIFRKNSRRKRSYHQENNDFLKEEKIHMDNVIKNPVEKENEEIKNYVDISHEESKEKRNIINKIIFNKPQFYFCFLCIRKFKNYQNVLIDEGMKLISEELDIRNLFINMLRCQKMKDHYKLEDSISMSDKCKNGLLAVNKKITDIKSFS